MKGDLEAGETIISVKCSEKHAVPVAVIGIFSKIFNYWRLKHDGLVVGYCFLAAHEIPNLDCFASCRGFACISNHGHRKRILLCDCQWTGLGCHQS